jgi:HlyD family secretion protein
MNNLKNMDRKIKKKKLTAKRITWILLVGGFLAFCFYKFVYGRFEIDMMFAGVQPKGITRGQTLHIRLELGNLSTAVLLPQGGFYQKTGGQWVYLINDTGEFAIKQTINLGRQNPEVFEVLGGLQRGERVITSAYDNYGDNIDKLVLK